MLSTYFVEARRFTEFPLFLTTLWSRDRWGNWSSERLRNFSRVAQLVKGSDKIPTQQLPFLWWLPLEGEGPWKKTDPKRSPPSLIQPMDLQAIVEKCLLMSGCSEQGRWVRELGQGNIEDPWDSGSEAVHLHWRAIASGAVLSRRCLPWAPEITWAGSKVYPGRKDVLHFQPGQGRRWDKL